jgi:hypothetical protein
MGWVERHVREPQQIVDYPDGSFKIQDFGYATVLRELHPLLRLANALAIGLGLATSEDPVFRDAQYDPAPGGNIYDATWPGEAVKLVPDHWDYKFITDIYRKWRQRMEVLKQKASTIAERADMAPALAQLTAGGMRVAAEKAAEAKALPAPAGAPPAAPISTKADHMSLTGKALAALHDHPDWEHRRIAKHIGCDVHSLYRLKPYMDARKLLKEKGKKELAHGSKYRQAAADHADLEAWDEDSDK